MKVVEYQLAMGTSPNALTSEVNSLLKQGFHALNGIAVSSVPPSVFAIYAQAMVKYSDEPDEPDE